MCVYTNLFYILLYSENVYYCVSIYKYAHHKIHLSGEHKEQRSLVLYLSSCIFIEKVSALMLLVGSW